MMAVMVTAGGCTSNDEGTQLGDAVPIKLAATIAPANTRGTAVSTRAAGDWGERSTTQDTELLEGQTVRAWISENDGSHTAAIKNPIEYTVSNATGDLEPVSDATPFYYPVGVNTISIHAIHPSGYDSGEKFTVNLDQTTEANYAASDLCYSQPADFTRSDVDANGRKLLQMKHLLSKIVVNLTLDENVTGATLPQAIKLHAMTSTVMTYPVDVATAANGYTGCTVSDASDLGAITMKQEAIIPPQTIAAGVSFITFNVDGIGPMLYPLPAATTFESGKRYTYNIRVKNVGLAVTTSVNDWGTKVANQNLIGKQDNIMNNPLWYVAEYNMAQNKTSFVTEHSTASQYVFNFAEAAQANVSGYHLPTRDEQISIIPSDKASSNGTNIFDLTGTLANPTAYSELACNIGSSSVAASTSWFGKNGDADYYAVRFIGTQYASAWHYKWVTSSCVGLLIESYLIPSSLSEADAKALLADLASSIIFTGTIGASGANQTPENMAATTSGYVQRFLPACGYRGNGGNGGSGTTDDFQNTNGNYWSASALDSSYGWYWFFSGSKLFESNAYRKYGYSVRLFINSGDPGIPMANVSASDVGKVVASNGKIYSTVTVANTYGATPSGVIAYVGTPGSVDASSSTYKCLVIGLEDANSGNTCTWYTASSGTCVSQTDNISTAVSLKNGIACTETLVNSNGTGVTANCNGHTHNAATLTRNYSATIPSGASTWFLPSIGQWQLIVQGLTGGTTSLTNSENNTYKASNVNTKIIAAGGTGFQSNPYWSSTETTTTHVYRMAFNQGAAYNDYKSNSYYVRAVFAY